MTAQQNYSFSSLFINRIPANQEVEIEKPPDTFEKEMFEIIEDYIEET